MRRVRSAMIGLMGGWALLIAGASTGKGPSVNLTLIPPSPVTDQITLDIRGAVWNRTDTARKYDVTLSLDGKKLHQETTEAAAQSPAGIQFRLPTKGLAGKHKVTLAARAGDRTLTMERPVEILASDARSTRRLGGAWVDICHHDPREGKPFDAELAKMTDAQWRELVRAMHAVDQDILVISMMFQNFTHRGRHKIETEGYQGRAYYPSKLYPGRMPTASADPLETIMDEADKLGMHVMPGVGCYAFFDFTPGSLQWCKQVAGELWELYGHHPSFYGWYMSHEKDGGLGSAEERQEIVAFFKEFTPYVHGLAPDKPVMLAPNCYHLRGAEATYRQLLPNLDILCPFAYHRMPANDLRGEEAATLMQALCDEAGCHLWMDVESFLFAPGGGLVPRSIGGLISDFTRFPTFEKTLHYQFPGLMSAPEMTRQPGGPASVKLYLDYMAYLKNGWGQKRPHAAVGKPVAFATTWAARYTGGGARALTDGLCATEDYRDGLWQGYQGSDLDAVVDLGEPTDIHLLSTRFLRDRRGGICLPPSVEFAASDDGREFKVVGMAKPVVSDKSPIAIGTAETLPKDLRARYIRVRATNVGTLPAGQPGAGTLAWLFVDEIVVNPEQR